MKERRHQFITELIPQRHLIHLYSPSNPALPNTLFLLPCFGWRRKQTKAYSIKSYFSAIKVRWKVELSLRLRQKLDHHFGLHFVKQRLKSRTTTAFMKKRFKSHFCFHQEIKWNLIPCLFTPQFTSGMEKQSQCQDDY